MQRLLDIGEECRHFLGIGEDSRYFGYRRGLQTFGCIREGNASVGKHELRTQKAASSAE